MKRITGSRALVKQQEAVKLSDQGDALMVELMLSIPNEIHLNKEAPSRYQILAGTSNHVISLHNEVSRLLFDATCLIQSIPTYPAGHHYTSLIVQCYYNINHNESCTNGFSCQFKYAVIQLLFNYRPFYHTVY